MSNFDEPQNALEHAIATLTRAGDDEDAGARRAVFKALAESTVTVILPPRDETGKPPEQPQPLFVSDGPNTEQPMLAAFTRDARARDFQSAFEGGDEGKGEGVAQRVEISGTQLLLGTPPGAGIMLNPNQPLGFRVLPDLAKAIRDGVLESAETLGERNREGPE